MTKALILTLTLAAPAAAIELSLEENRAERGTAGIVDMQRLFKASPDAARAREGMEELVRQAEERVNSKKAEILRFRQDLETLRMERDAVARSTPTPVTPPAPPSTPPPAPKAAATTPAPAATGPVPAPIGATPAVLPPVPPPPAPMPTPPPAPTRSASSPASDRSADGDDVEPESVTSLPPPGRNMPLNLPGLSTGPMTITAPPSGSDGPPAALPSTLPPATPAPAATAPPAAPAQTAQPATPPQNNLPSTLPSTLPDPLSPSPAAAPAAPSIPAGPTIAERLAELDVKIATRQAELSRAEAELDRERLNAERNLLDSEGRKTDQVLARLYRAISEVARREGVSVVLDKTTTLYGHPAVDLTDKVLRQLRGVALQ